MRIELYTRNGEFVAVAQIPEFGDPPDVVVWGQRIFCTPNTDNLSIDADPDSFAYTEAFAYSIPSNRAN